MGNRVNRGRSSSLPKDIGVRRRRFESLEAFNSRANTTADAYSHSTILLLGCGDAGKTTLCTRWRLWVEQSRKKRLEPNLKERHMVGETLKSYFEEVIRNIIIDQVDFEDGAVNDIVHNFQQRKKEITMVPLSKQASRMLSLLWNNAVFQKEFQRKYRNTEIETTLRYFFADFERFSSKKLELRPEDILHCRVRTTGIITREFYTVNNRNIQIVDVAGQRAERHKWNVKFTSSDLVVYLCAVSEFDQVLYEDGKTNRLVESLNSFESIMTEPDLYDTKVLLLMTKIDLFEKKIAALKEEGQSVKEAFAGEIGDSLEEDMGSTEIIDVIEAKFREKAFDNFTTCLKVNLLDAGDQKLFEDVNSILESIDKM